MTAKLQLLKNSSDFVKEIKRNYSFFELLLIYH